jgi:LAO/AO transport system kinase
MRTDPADVGVFVRSLAARGRLGGLADIAYPATVLLRALYDKVIVESVGVGQSETEIDSVSDTVLLCIQPGSGDSLQFMKAGIVEIPDIAAVTKADMGAIATRALADLKGALGLAHRDGSAWEPQCLAVSAATGSGLGPLLDLLARHETWLRSSGRLPVNRRTQAALWLQAETVTNFGRKGLDAAEKALSSFSGDMPFSLARRLLSQLQVIERSPLA